VLAVEQQMGLGKACYRDVMVIFVVLERPKRHLNTTLYKTQDPERPLHVCAVRKAPTSRRVIGLWIYHLGLVDRFHQPIRHNSQDSSQSVPPFRSINDQFAYLNHTPDEPLLRSQPLSWQPKSVYAKVGATILPALTALSVVIYRQPRTLRKHTSTFGSHIRMVMSTTNRPSGCATMLRLATLLLLVGVSSQQLIGTDICACQPSVVTFQLNFTLDCPGNNVEGPGIIDSACIIETRGSDNVTDEVPIIVSTVQVLELGGADLAVLDDTTFQEGEGYFDGDTITYTSIVERSPETITAENIPRGFQVTITGLNANEETLVNQWIITYDNDCGIFPLLRVGQQIGWSVFVSAIRWQAVV
jgi:hypothetical protein